MATKQSEKLLSKEPGVRIVKAGVKVNGVLQRDAEWLKARVELLENKKADYAVRIKNAEAEIKQRKAELEALK